MSILSSDLASKLTACSLSQFTGQLQIAGSDPWILYFFLGRIVGDSGGIHPVRRWRRQLSQCCAHLSQDSEALPPSQELERGNFQLIETLLRRNRISRDQAVALIEGSLNEVFFDILHHEEQLRATGKFLTITQVPETLDRRTETPLILVKVEYVWKHVSQAWQLWHSQPFRIISPNLAPKIVNLGQLQTMVAPATYAKLTKLINGQRTLRDLGVKLGQDPLSLTKSLLAYSNAGLMSLMEVPDLAPLVESVTEIKRGRIPTAPTRKVLAPIRGLIAHVDDNPLDIQIMERILTEAGYRYVNVQDPMQALATLLKHRPDFIFLDLVMPIANGYEICAQFRRVSQFKETPIVILTGNDGIVDRVRAKMVNSTAFLAKPIDRDPVLSMIQRYLPPAESVYEARLNVAPA